jgi:hypothetical protein
MQARIDAGAVVTVGETETIIDGVTVSFCANDFSHPRGAKLRRKCEDVAKQIQLAGHRPDVSWATRQGATETRAKSLRYHSERIAIAYNLLVTPLGTPIRLVNNLRVCAATAMRRRSTSLVSTSACLKCETSRAGMCLAPTGSVLVGTVFSEVSRSRFANSKHKNKWLSATDTGHQARDATVVGYLDRATVERWKKKHKTLRNALRSPNGAGPEVLGVLVSLAERRKDSDIISEWLRDNPWTCVSSALGRRLARSGSTSSTGST